MHVVTGATGHIGVNLVRALAISGQPVRALSRSAPPEGLFDGLDVQFARFDLLDPDSMESALVDADVVYHLAGLISITGGQDGMVERINVQGTRLVAQAALAQGVRRMVHVSSVQAFDIFSQTDEITEESPKATPSAPAYDRSKAQSEAVIHECIAEGLDAVIVNPTGVLGPIDHRPSRLGQGLIDIRDGRVPALVSGKINVVDVRDVVDGIIAAAQSGLTGHNYLLSGHALSVPKLLRSAAAITGVESPGLVCPMWLARMSAPFTVGWASLTKQEPLYTGEALRTLRGNNQVSHQKASDTLGYSPRPLDQTLRDLFANLKALGL